jgi:hypothetical protein
LSSFGQFPITERVIQPVEIQTLLAIFVIGIERHVDPLQFSAALSERTVRRPIHPRFVIHAG